MKLPVQ
jgi:hypothetical protein